MTLRDEVENLFYRYARGYDEVDLDGLAACFTTDAELFSGDWLRGRDTIVRELGERRQARADLGQLPRHITTNIAIERVGDDEAEVHSLFSLAATTRDASVIETIGTYTDRIVREDGKWLIARRVIARDEWT
jgi:3-phenylpropionate/cinnamic acid dioxygenase small subunit